jgi:hypothetical protein
MSSATMLRRNTTVDYTRTCGQCSKYIDLSERINEIGVHEAEDGELLFGWYAPNGSWISKLCDQCYLAAKFEGWV